MCWSTGNWSSMATDITLARVVQAGAYPVDTLAVLSELMGTWNRPDAMEFGSTMALLMPDYQLAIESYEKGISVAEDRLGVAKSPHGSVGEGDGRSVAC